MIKTIIIAICMAALVCVSLFAGGSVDEVVPAFEKYPEALGFQYGVISGAGLSYLSWKDTRGLQIAGGGYYSYGSFNYSIGAELQYQVFGDAIAQWLSGQLYLFAGLNHEGNSYGGSYQAKVGPGAGIGIELILFDHFSIPLELGYAFKWIPTAAVLAEQFSLDLAPQAGFRYRY